MRFTRHLLHAYFVALTAYGLLGCNKSPYDLAPVHGTVKIGGKPLAGASIMFAPEVSGSSVNSGKPAFGQLDANGAFVLGTYNQTDGAVVGDHTVTISRQAPQTGDGAATTGAPVFRSIVVPGKFHVAMGQDNQIDITLTTDELTRYARFDR